VIDVKKLTNNDLTALGSMGRPDLSATFTKIALWQQTQFRKIIYLDADTLPLRSARNRLPRLLQQRRHGP
jgi:glycogenin glucosyltransferase